jgi:Regulator of G protein signaling domain
VPQQLLQTHILQALQHALLSYSKKSHCAENFAFIIAVGLYKGKLAAGDTAGADAHRTAVCEKFISPGELQVNLPFATVAATLKSAASSDVHCFDAAAEEVCKLLSTDIWPQFRRSAEYAALTAAERSSAYAVNTSTSSTGGTTVHKQQKQQRKQQPQRNEQQQQQVAAVAPSEEKDDGNISSASSSSSSSSSSGRSRSSSCTRSVTSSSSTGTVHSNTSSAVQSPAKQG